jgi:hypothetical protein
MGDFDNAISKSVVYNDSLIIGGGFWTIDNDSMNFIAKWDGGNYMDTCSLSNSIEENNLLSEITVFPNPFNSYLKIEPILPNTIISIYNLYGSCVKNKIYNGLDNTFIIDTSELPRGNYFITLLNGNSNQHYKLLK